MPTAANRAQQAVGQPTARHCTACRCTVPALFYPQSLVNYLASSYGGKEDASTMSKGLMPLKVLGNAAGVDDEVRLPCTPDLHALCAAAQHI